MQRGPGGVFAVSIIVRPDDVRRQNQLGIMLALRRHGNLSRTELSAATGLSASTVTVITNSLIQLRVIQSFNNTDFLNGVTFTRLIQIGFIFRQMLNAFE